MDDLTGQRLKSIHDPHLDSEVLAIVAPDNRPLPRISRSGRLFGFARVDRKCRAAALSNDRGGGNVTRAVGHADRVAKLLLKRGSHNPLRELASRKKSGACPPYVTRLRKYLEPGQE